MGRRMDFFRPALTPDLGHPANVTLGWEFHWEPSSCHDVAFAAALHVVKWRLTKDSPKLHVSEPIRTRGAALIEARTLVEAGAYEVWIERQDGTRIEADGTIRPN